MVRKITTDEAAPQKFAPHGRFEYQTLDDQGLFLHIQCQGPFDEELIKAISEVQKHPELLNPNRKEVFEFTISCLGIPEFVAAASEYVSYLTKQGQAPKAVALVMPDEIEGSLMMRDTYLNIYKQFDIEAQVFEDASQAIDWLNQL